MPKLTKKILGKLKEKSGAIGKQAIKALSLPQEILMKKAAEVVGAEPGKNSEESAFNIVDKVSKRVGLGDDAASNAVKGLAVGALETFADPLGPVGKISKVGKLKKLKKLIGKGPSRQDLERLVKKAPTVTKGGAKEKLVKSLGSKKGSELATVKDPLTKRVQPVVSGQQREAKLAERLLEIRKKRK